MVLMRAIFKTLWDYTLNPVADAQSQPSLWSMEDWTRFVAYARHHRVAALLAHRIQRGLLPSPPEHVTPLLQKELHTTRLRQVVAQRALDDISAAFEQQGIPFVWLKGPPLAAEAYDTLGLRSFDDLDILVEPDATDQATHALGQLGYKPLPHSLPQGWVRRYHFHTQWIQPQSRQVVELHWRPADTKILPCTDSDISYVQDLRDEPAAMPVYLAAHLAKHAMAWPVVMRNQIDPLIMLHPWSGMRLIWLADFRGLLAARSMSRNDLNNVAERWQCSAALAFTYYLLDPPDSLRSTPLSRFATHSALLRRMLRDVEQSTWPTRMPWWLRSHPRTGFRPIRLLDIFHKKNA